MKKRSAQAEAGASASRVAELVRQLHETQQSLEEMTGGEVDAVVHPGGQSYLLFEAQETLRQSEAAQRQLAETQIAILNALPAQLAILDHTGVIVSVNGAWRAFALANGMNDRTFGVGRSYLAVCEGVRGKEAEDAGASAAGIRRVLSGETREFSLDYPCHAPTEQRWFRLLASPLPGSPGGAVILHLNITEQTLASEALRESEARFRGTFEHAAVGIAHISLEGAFLRVNDKLCAILGYRRDDLIGRNVNELTLPEDLAGGLESRRAMQADEIDTYTAERRYRRKDGELVWLDLATTLQRCASGPPDYFISVCEDITARKVAEFRLHRLNRLHTVLSKAGEAIVHTPDRLKLYAEVCRIVVEDGLLPLACIVGIDARTGRAIPEAAFGTGQEFLDGLAISTGGGPRSDGTVGTSLRSGKHDFCNDLADDPRMADWSDGALRYGFRATASFPLKLGTVTIGALVLFANETGYFQEDEIRLMVAVAGELSFALDAQQQERSRQRAELALRQSEAGMAAAQRIAHLGSWELSLTDLADVDANPLYWSDEMHRIAGFVPGQVRVTNELFFELIPPEERALIKEAVATAIRERGRYSIVHRLKRADGSQRILHEAGELLLDERTGQPSKLIGTAHDITERRQAEEIQHEQAAMLTNAQRIGRMGSWNLDATSGRLAWSEATCELFGIKPAEFEGTFAHFLRFILPEDRTSYEATQARVSATSPLLEAEYRICRPDGAVRWMFERGNVTFDAAGAPTGAVGMVMDITEQRTARAQLAQNAALLRIAGRIARLGGWTIKLPERTLFWSDENCAIHEVLPGYQPTLEEGIGYYPPEFRDEVARAVELCAQDGTPYDFEVPKFTAKGRRIWVRSIGEAVRDAEGRIIRLQGAFQDVTARKQAEETLREKNALLRIAGRVTHTGGWAVEKADQELFWSDEIFNLLEFPTGTVPTAEDALALFPEPWRDQVRAMIAVCARDGTSFDREVEIQTTRGRRLWVRICGEAERATDGSIKRVEGAFQDISERKTLEQHAQRTQRMESIGTLSGGIAHDLNNSLAPIILGLELLKMRFPDAASQDLLASISTSAHRGADMVRQLLSFARGVEGRRTEVPVLPLVREIEKIANDTFLKNIQIRTILPRDLWTVMGDPTQLHQVLLNLAVNARDAMPEGGTLTLSAENVELDAHFAELNPDAQAGPHLLLQVADNGTGIPPEILESIFDPFFTTKEIGKGTGLGLSTSQAIVRSHGGFIRVNSAPGKGTTFQIYFPARVEVSTAAAADRAATLPRGHGELILVVDDEPAVRQITQQTLEAFGYRVVVAANGEEAVAVYTSSRPAVVLTDLMMPVMNGLASIPILLALNPRLPIIAASGLPTSVDVTKARELGARHFLPKPFSTEALLKAVQEALLGSEK